MVDEDFDVEIHAVAGVVAAEEGGGRSDGIEAVAAHAVRDIVATGVYPDPEVTDFATVKAGFGGIGAIDGATADEGVRVLLSGGEEAGNVGEIVLAVGVNLQGVAVALLRDPMDAVFDRGTFAAIMRAFEEGNGGVVRREFSRCGKVCDVGTVVNDKDGQSVRTQGGADGREGGTVVVVRDEGYGLHGRS